MQDDKNAIFQMRFPQKLWYLLNLGTDAILWGGTRRTILLNYRVLHNYLQCDHSIFKTANISSFIRQLNLYGFRKVTSHLQDPLCNSSNPYMHEYVHDYFQFGRPELLNKITRKALTMRKNIRINNLCDTNEQFLYVTPLQKARRALQVALRKAAQDLLIQNSPKQLNKFELNCEDTVDDYEDDWSTPDNTPSSPEKSEEPDEEPKILVTTCNLSDNKYREPSQENLTGFNEPPCQQSNDFESSFLNMPELDPVPDESSSVELLAEFNIENDMDQDIAMKTTDKQNYHSSLNCVLPSISTDQIDDISMVEKNQISDHYNDGEWDQMLNDIMINKGSNQECSSDLKELYSQISRTIDLLNS